MNAEEKSSYFKELAGNLQHEGFTVGPEADGLLPVELDGQRLCLAMDTGKVRYWKEDVLGDSRSAALDRVTDIVKTTAEYMSQMEAAPQLGVGPEADGLLPVELDGQRLCLAMDTGRVRYWKEDVLGGSRSAALDRVTDIVRTTAEYMSQMEAAPQLGIGPKGDYRLLADFNNIVLAGHPTQYGVQFVTWERVQEGTALHQGDYYGPCAGVALPSWVVIWRFCIGETPSSG